MRLRDVSNAADRDLYDRVFSVLPNKAAYRCTDITELDDHLRDLSARLLTIVHNSALSHAYRADQDALLERRAYLRMLSPRMEK
jgi:hypothetical protein